MSSLLPEIYPLSFPSVLLPKMDLPHRHLRIPPAILLLISLPNAILLPHQNLPLIPVPLPALFQGFVPALLPFPPFLQESLLSLLPFPPFPQKPLPAPSPFQILHSKFLLLVSLQCLALLRSEVYRLSPDSQYQRL